MKHVQCRRLKGIIYGTALWFADEIRESLPAWTVNGVSPLENIGEQVPTANYSYAQAGRLYDSFRKKKRARATRGDQAEGGLPHPRPTVTDGIELRVMGHEDHRQQHHGDEYDGRQYQDHQDYNAYASGHGAGYNASGYQNGYDKGGYQDGYYKGAYQNGPDQWRGQCPEDDGFHEERGAKPKRVVQPDTHGHMYPEVKAISDKSKSPRSDGFYPSAPPMEGPNAYANIPLHKSPNPYTNVTPKAQEEGPYSRPLPARDSHESTPLSDRFTRLRMQGSDRSSHSETGSYVADSGICSDSDGHVREGSCDKPFNPQLQKHSPTHPYAMDNHGFDNDETDVREAMRKHKELIAKMMGEAHAPTAQVDASVEQSSFHDNRQQRYAPQSSYGDNGGHYAARSSALPAPYSKSGVPSPSSLNGHDYTATGNTHYGQGRGYGQMTQNNVQQVDESFI